MPKRLRAFGTYLVLPLKSQGCEGWMNPSQSSMRMQQKYRDAKK